MLGRILIADDEETFLLSTADLLRREGYDCDCVSDARAAVEMLGRGDYDLLVADIRMPGNPELELIQDVPQMAEGLSVILVTGYPSLRTAIQSIELPVVAYLIKPLDFDQFLTHAKFAVQSSQFYRTFLRIKQRLQDWNQNMNVIGGMLDKTRRSGSSLPFSDFLMLNYQYMVNALSDLMNLTEVIGKQSVPQEICHLLKCPRLSAMGGVLAETIDVLKMTKGSFKSKDLGELRKKLEDFIKGTG
jgi:DNA-binding response OmpR family regulator